MVSFFNKIRENKIFQSTVVLAILFAAALVGLGTFDLEPRHLAIVSVLDSNITYLFLIEILIRFIGEPKKLDFFKNGWNVFDTTIVVISLIPEGIGASILVLRLLRILRIPRLISTVPELRLLVESLVRSLSKVFYVLLLLFLFMYIYAAIGSLYFESIDPQRWGNIGISLLTLTQVLTLSGWERVFFPVQNEYWWAWIYFFSFIALSAFTVINLIIAVLVDTIRQQQAR